MSAFSVTAWVLFVVLFIGVASDDLAPFAKKTKQNLSPETFQKVYGTHFKDDNDIKTAVQKGIPELGKEFGIKIPDKVIQLLTQGALAIKDKLTPDLFFRLYANPEDEILRNEGVLNDGNVDKLAKQYADILKEKAKKVKKPDLVETLPAVAGALGKFLNELGVNKSVAKPLFEKVVTEFTKIQKGKKN